MNKYIIYSYIWMQVQIHLTNISKQCKDYIHVDKRYIYTYIRIYVYIYIYKHVHIPKCISINGLRERVASVQAANTDRFLPGCCV